MTSSFLTVYCKETQKRRRQPLALAKPGDACPIRLRCLPGASALHLILGNEDSPALRAEMPAQGGETVLIHIALDDAGGFEISCPSREVWLFPPDNRYAPPLPIDPTQEAALDIALVVDGTCRVFYLEDGEERRFVTSRFLLQDPDLWPDLWERMTSFVTALRKKYRDQQVSVLAFGDHRLEKTAAQDLQPSYVLYPPREDSRALRPMSKDELQRQLSTLPPTSGGDFVDALGDALEACTRLHWRPEARKILLAFGDSPGACVLDPPMAGADAHVRSKDVDQLALHLQRLGVEIITVYQDTPADVGLEDLAFRQELLGHVQRQYRNLASLPSLAFRASSFDGPEAARALLELTGPLGRGPALGEWIEIGDHVGDAP